MFSRSQIYNFSPAYLISSTIYKCLFLKFSKNQDTILNGIWNFFYRHSFCNITT